MIEGVICVLLIGWLTGWFEWLISRRKGFPGENTMVEGVLCCIVWFGSLIRLIDSTDYISPWKWFPGETTMQERVICVSLIRLIDWTDTFRAGRGSGWNNYDESVTCVSLIRITDWADTFRTGRGFQVKLYYDRRRKCVSLHDWLIDSTYYFDRLIWLIILVLLIESPFIGLLSHAFFVRWLIQLILFIGLIGFLEWSFVVWSIISRCSSVSPRNQPRGQGKENNMKESEKNVRTRCFSRFPSACATFCSTCEQTRLGGCTHAHVGHFHR